MKHLLITSAIILFIVAGVLAGNDWVRINYRQSTVFSAIVTNNGKPAQAGDIVGAFVGTECRMTAVVFIYNDTAFVSSVIHGEQKEMITFRLWSKSEDKIYPIENTLQSDPGGSIHLFKLNAVKP